MKSALLACLALGSVHVNGEALEQLAAADPDAVSVILDTPGVQADCTVIKAAYRSAQCDCTDDNNPSTMRSLEEKLSIRVTVPAETTPLVISAGRMEAVSTFDDVAPLQTSWKFWMAVQAGAARGVGGANIVQLFRMGSVGGEVLYPRGDRYHYDWYRQPADTNSSSHIPVLPLFDDVYKATNRMEEDEYNAGNMLAQDDNAAWFRVTKGELSQIQPDAALLTEPSMFYYKRHSPVTFIEQLTDQWFACNSYTINGRTVMGGKCIHQSIANWDSTDPALYNWWYLQQYPYNFIRKDDGTNCYVDVTPHPNSDSAQELSVATATGQKHVVYCEGNACNEVLCSTITTDDYVDMTARDVSWDQYPSVARYEAARDAFIASEDGLDSENTPTLSNLPAGVLQRMAS